MSSFKPTCARDARKWLENELDTMGQIAVHDRYGQVYSGLKSIIETYGNMMFSLGLADGQKETEIKKKLEGKKKCNQ